MRSSNVANAHDLYLAGAARCLHFHHVTCHLADQCARNRRADGNLADLEVRFVFADDLVGRIFLIVEGFDSSKDRGEPFAFDLGTGGVVKGWGEGVQGMKVGGARTLNLPAALGYGARRAGGVIPPNATLMFKVELLAV